MKLLNLLALIMVTGCAGQRTKLETDNLNKEVLEVQSPQFKYAGESSKA